MANGTKIGDLNISYFKVGGSDCSIYLGNTLVYPTTIDYSKQYLTLVAETDNVTVTLYGGNNGNTFQYSTNSGSTWNNVSIGQTTSSINNGDKIMFKASGVSINNNIGIGTIRPSAAAHVEGNIMSLLYGDNFIEQTVIPRNFNLRNLFSAATNITSAENLVIPATTVKKQCYSQMFQGCTNLVTAPKVIGSSAMTWSGDYCWSDMFHGCTSLVNAPQLPATTLGTQCYWFMFEGCTALETAPVLPALTLNNQCYQGMFDSCSSLNYIKAMFTTAPSTTYTRNWVSGVASSGTFVKNSAATWSVNCGTSAVPCNWNVITESE